jgi:hypothetical protein
VKEEQDKGGFDPRALYSALKSLKFGMGLVAAIAIASAVGTFVQQTGEAQYGVLGKLGLTRLYHSRWFLCLLGLLVLNVVLCLSARLRSLKRRPGLLLAHASIVFMAAGALIGARWGTDGSMKLLEGEKKDYFDVKTRYGTKRVPLGFSVGLEDFVLERYGSSSGGVVLVRGQGQESIESFPVEVGRTYKVLGERYSLEILRELPDFQMSLETGEIVSASDNPNNPAVQIKISGNGEEETRWLFAKHPNIHGSQQKLPLEAQYSLGGSSYIKDYKSKLWIEKNGSRVLAKTIEVNDPLAYKGYNFYQSSYDERNLSWTGLQVVKDPGVPAMYVGFTMLCVGVTVELYLRGWRASRRKNVRREK